MQVLHSCSFPHQEDGGSPWPAGEQGHSKGVDRGGGGGALVSHMYCNWNLSEPPLWTCQDVHLIASLYAYLVDIW